MTVIENLTVRDFRNYQELTLPSLGPLTILAGPNGAGKTNLIEAIQMLCAGSSFRHATFAQMIAAPMGDVCVSSADEDERRASVSAHLRDGERLVDVVVRLNEHGRTYLVNGKSRRPAAVRDIVATVTFTPDDLSLVKGAMGPRRSALDSLGSRLSATYHSVVTDFTKVLRHKNKLLHEGTTPDVLDAIDELIIGCGAQLCCLRLTLLSRFAPHLIGRYEEIAQTNETLAVRYTPSWTGGAPDRPGDYTFADARYAYELTRDEAREAIREALADRRDEEIQRGRALVGPQADRIDYLVDGGMVESYASQGQQRTLVLAHKLGEAATIEDVREVKPIMLLDDVMSELDERRRTALLAYLTSGAQTFITTTNLAYFDEELVDAADVLAIDRGRLCNR